MSKKNSISKRRKDHEALKQQLLAEEAERVDKRIKRSKKLIAPPLHVTPNTDCALVSEESIAKARRRGSTRKVLKHKSKREAAMDKGKKKIRNAILMA
ncbi:hypothetical protein GNI_080880 [Gregarina niphandrodes]|uniref:Uncharacterized protein n=1 Tax=Gregarina niphandrodes TaxID=110365 RepID=A0A023B6E7_GRENI|nr:hypothetical protein GNI_080880 [Gregarina niphandrodes]EZG66185.1 hypothetical protein GNI_080880 [Gregarina niphandrodes]|eukprot:XP_011134008.1 hypothetical protein GNI_080880 [Gregarina niphandrodes]